MNEPSGPSLVASGLLRWLASRFVNHPQGKESHMKIATFATVLMLSTVAVPFAAAASQAEALKEARAIQTAESKETGRPAYSPGHGVNFKPSDHVFVKSALAIDFTRRCLPEAFCTICALRTSPLGSTTMDDH